MPSASRAPAQTRRLEARAIVPCLVRALLSASPRFASAEAMPRLLVFCLLPRRRVTPLGLQIGRRLTRLEPRRRQRPKPSAVSGGPRLRMVRSGVEGRARSARLRRERLDGRGESGGQSLARRCRCPAAFGGPGRLPLGPKGEGRAVANPARCLWPSNALFGAAACCLPSRCCLPSHGGNPGQHLGSRVQRSELGDR